MMSGGLAHDFDLPDLSDGLEAMTLTKTNSDEQWWTNFLKELPSKAIYERNKVNRQGALKNGDGTLVERVGEDLEKQQAETKKKNEADRAKADATLEHSLQQLLDRVCYGYRDSKLESRENAETHMQPLQLFPSILNDFKSIWDDYVKGTKKTKSDLECSGSTWTIKMLARYVKQEDVDFMAPSREEEISNLLSRHKELLDKIKEKLDMVVAAMNEFRTECDTRMLLDAILLTICAHHKDLFIRTEQSMKFISLPNNIPDYIVYCRDRPIAVVEAKRPGCLIQSSLAQLIQQLLCLSAEDPYFPYFGLLFDGFTSVFAAVSEQKILFFQEKDCQLRVYNTQPFADLGYKVAVQLLWLLETFYVPVLKQ